MKKDLVMDYIIPILMIEVVIIANLCLIAILLNAIGVIQ